MPTTLFNSIVINSANRTHLDLRTAPPLLSSSLLCSALSVVFYFWFLICLSIEASCEVTDSNNPKIIVLLAGVVHGLSIRRPLFRSY